MYVVRWSVSTSQAGSCGKLEKCQEKKTQEPKCEKQYKIILLVNVRVKSVEGCSKSVKVSESGIESPLSR